VDISGATITDFNGTNLLITAVNINSFSYTSSGTQGTTAGSVVMSVKTAYIPIKSNSSGLITNFLNGDKITLSTPIAAINNDGFVGYQNLTGGNDIELIQTLSKRGLQAKRGSSNGQNKTFFIQKALSIVSKAWISVNGEPAVFNMWIEPFSITNQGLISTMMLEYQLTTHWDSVNILQPTYILVDITITSLVPDIIDIRNSIVVNLTEYFNSNMEVNTTTSPVLHNIDLIKSIIQRPFGNIFPTFASSTANILTTNFGEKLKLNNVIFV